MAKLLNKIDVEIGRFIRGLHDRGRDRLEAAATKAGLSVEELEQVMTGERRLYVNELYTLSKALDVPVDQFFAGLTGSAHRCSTR